MKSLPLILLTLAFTACVDITPAKVIEASKAARQLSHDGKEILNDWNPVFRSSATSVHWRENGEFNQDNPPFLVRAFPHAYALLTNGL